MAVLLSTEGRAILIDAADLPWAQQFKWHTRKGKRGVWYAYRTVQTPNKRVTTRYLHRDLLGFPRGDKRLVDHADRDGLNNQRSNLRTSTRSQNQANAVTPHRNDRTSPFKGVSLHRRTSLWRARIKVNYKGVTLGYYKTQELAARAYNAAAVMHFGEFARLNHLPCE